MRGIIILKLQKLSETLVFITKVIDGNNVIFVWKLALVSKHSAKFRVGLDDQTVLEMTVLVTNKITTSIEFSKITTRKKTKRNRIILLF